MTRFRYQSLAGWLLACLTVALISGCGGPDAAEQQREVTVQAGQQKQQSGFVHDHGGAQGTAAAHDVKIGSQLHKPGQ